jgi:hypothetical protein
MVVQVSKQSVWAAAAALIALAAFGLYQGWQRSAADADVTASSDGLLPTTNPVAAKNASALVEPPPPILTEAQIRTIARQEAQAALTRPAEEPAPRPAAGATPSPPPTPAVKPAPLPVPPPAAEPPPLY